MEHQLAAGLDMADPLAAEGAVEALQHLPDAGDVDLRHDLDMMLARARALPVARQRPPRRRARMGRQLQAERIRQRVQDMFAGERAVGAREEAIEGRPELGGIAGPDGAGADEPIELGKSLLDASPSHS